MQARGATMILGDKDTRRYENSGPDGDRFRREIKGLARTRANRLGKPITIYASARAGGYVFDQVWPDLELDDSRLPGRASGTKKSIVAWDIDEAFSLCSLGRGEPSCVYWMSAKGPRGYYVTVVVDAGHFVDNLATDDGPYAKDSEAFLAGLSAAAEWFSNNGLRYSSREFNAYLKRAPNFDR